MRKLHSLLFLLGLFPEVLSEGTREAPSEADFLYFDPDQNEPVIEYVPALGSTRSHGDFRKSTKPKVVEFYNPFCGACQSYKPTFLKLAKDLKKEAEDDLEIYAVSCQVHNALCNEYRIEDIPTVGLFLEGGPSPSSLKTLTTREKKPSYILPYLFPPDEELEASENRASKGESGEDDNNEENADSNALSSKRRVSESRPPRRPRTLAPGHVPAHLRLKQEKGLDLRKANIAPRPIEGAGATLNKENIGDMERYQDALKGQHDKQKSIFKRQEPLGKHAEKTKNENIDKISGATNAMKAHMPGTEEYKDRNEKLQQNLDAFLKKQRLRTTSPAPITKSAGATSDLPPNHKPNLPYKKDAKLIKRPRYPQDVAAKVPLIKRLVKLSREEELILDASLSFLHSLKTGLFSDPGPLNKHKKRTLQNWLDLLRVSLPPEWGLHETIMDLDNNMDFISQNNVNLLKVLSKHELQRTQWSHSCTTGPQGVYGAFNCGFWKLLHIVTVGVAEHQGGLNLVESNLVSHEARVFSPADAAEVIKEFIGDFFPCTECRSHFVAQYDECSNRRCVRLTDEIQYASFADWQELAKWLWEVHNDVNVRLLSERFTKLGRTVTINDEVGALYPNLKTCVSCFRADGGYDEDGIFLFLEKEYWPGASSYDPKADRLLYYYDTEYVGFAKAWAFLFLGVGIIYLCRPRGVYFRKQKKRAD